MAETSKETVESNGTNIDQQTADLYRKLLTFNVIGKYDPQIKHLIADTYHSTIFKYVGDNWTKLDIEGVLALYSRNFQTLDNANTTGVFTREEVMKRESYPFGILILNRLNLDNWNVGLINNSSIENGDGIKLEMKDGLIIIKNLQDEVYGIWIHDEEIKKDLYKSLEIIVNS